MRSVINAQTQRGCAARVIAVAPVVGLEGPWAGPSGDRFEGVPANAFLHPMIDRNVQPGEWGVGMVQRGKFPRKVALCARVRYREGVAKRVWTQVVHSRCLNPSRQAPEGVPMASTRADQVAHLLFELKRGNKLSTYSLIARRAGFNPGANGRTMESCLKVVRRDWPHLHWWRAIKDDGSVETEQETLLRQAGYDLQVPSGAKTLQVVSIETHVMTWEEVAPPVAEA